MSEERPLRTTGTDAERWLLAAGSAELPDPASVRKAAAGLGLFPKAVVVGSAMALGLRARSFASLVARGVLPVAGMAAVIVVAYAVVQRGGAVGSSTLAPVGGAVAGRASSAGEMAPVAALAPEPSASGTAEPVEAPRAVAPRATPARAAIRSNPSGPMADNLREQAELLDKARARVGTGDSNGALALLDDYDRRFAGAPLSEESHLIRIEALVRRGDRNAASALARRFLGTYPASVHVDRVTALLNSLSP